MLNECFIFWHIRVNCNDNAFIAIIIQLNEWIAQGPFQEMKDQDENRTLKWPHCCTSHFEFSLWRMMLFRGRSSLPLYIYIGIYRHIFFPSYQRWFITVFNPLTQKSFTTAFVSYIRNCSLVSNSVYFQIFHFERIISLAFTCARCWECGWGAHIRFPGGTHRWQAAWPLKDVYLLQMFANQGHWPTQHHPPTFTCPWRPDYSAYSVSICWV